MTIVKNDLYDYTNRYIFQDSDCFKFSLDSILLAEYISLKQSDKIIIDMCAGNMSIPLILTKYYNNSIVGFEIQKNIYELGLKSIEINNLNKKLTIINDNVNNLDNYYKTDSIDVLICNPPFFKVSTNSFVNEKESLKIARHEITITLEKVISLSSKFLKNKGTLYLVHRVERLDEIISLGYKYHTYVKEIIPVCTKANKDPYLVLIKLIKGSKPGIKLKKNINVEKLTSYQHLFKK